LKAVQQIYSDESDKAIEKIFYDIDTNESGYLEFHEFENAFTKMKKTPVI
jgi:Ca2+-binding EF-hand superfamily protein